MTEAKEKKRVPLRRGAFEIPEEPGAEPHLVGVKCRKCGKYFFPMRHVCLNCGGRELDKVPLKGKGKLYTYTIVRQQLPGSLVQVPYGLAMVSLEEGCQLETVVTEGFESLEIGMDMEVYFEKIREDAEGNDQIVFKVRAVKS